jgi:hypothetical protein
MNFSKALNKIKEKERLFRSGWNCVNQYIEMQLPSEDSKMQLPFIYIKNAQDKLIPWLASQGDLFGEDWEIYIGT